MNAGRSAVAVSIYAALAALATVGCALAGRSAWHLDTTLGRSRAVSIPVALCAGALVGLGAIVATQRLARATRWGRALSTELGSALTGLEPRWIPWLALSSAGGEELLFRGAVQAGLVDHGGVAQGLLLTSVLFGALHIPANRRLVPWTLMATGMGLIFGLLYYWTGEIVAPLVAHAMVNFANLRFLSESSAVAARVRGDDGRPLSRPTGVGR